MDHRNRANNTLQENNITEIEKFTDSYASFNRIVNSLQRKYLELKDDFTEQNEKLVEANKKLVELTKSNIAVTEFLNSILNSVSAGVIAVNQNGYITHFNHAASRMLGIPRKEPFDKLYRNIIPPGEPVDANALRAAETGKEVNSIEKKIELADGSHLQISVSTAILKDNEDRPVGAVEIFQDLTKIKKMEKEIARLNTLAALGEMAATVAHEVRNPLAGIGGFAALLERDFDESDPKRDLVKKIIRGVESLNKTVTTLLNYTRNEEINCVCVDYGNFIKSTIEQFKNNNINKLKDVRFEFDDSPISDKQAIILKIDKLLFRQVFYNIFTNAVEAFKGKGTIEIKTRKLPRQTAITRYADKLMLGIDETIVETAVIDNGPGIDKEHLEKIFAPFYTNKQGGTGLGLAIAWKIMKAHTGEIFVENVKNGKGVAFYLLIPTPIDNVYRESKK
ncbi:MAG: PAS domain-containing protein [FCB group bacterium]|nr:PAS domain-containing protein [FCB group bacterium]